MRIGISKSKTEKIIIKQQSKKLIINCKISNIIKLIKILETLNNKKYYKNGNIYIFLNQQNS